MESSLGEMCQVLPARWLYTNHLLVPDDSIPSHSIVGEHKVSNHLMDQTAAVPLTIYKTPIQL